MTHPDPRHLRLYFGRLPGEAREILHHLLTCRRCQEELLADAAAPLPRPDDYAQVFESAMRSTTARLAERRARAPEVERLLDELLALECTAWPELVEQRPACRTVDFVVALADRAEREWPQDVLLSGNLAALAADVADLLPAGDWCDAAEDAVVRALALEGFTRARLEGLPAGEQLFALASQLVAGSQAGTLAEAFFCHVVARAYVAAGRLTEAAALAERSAAIYGELGQLESDVQELLFQAQLEARLGRLPVALDVLRGAVMLAEGDGERLAHLDRVARQRLAWLFVLGKDYGSAAHALAPDPSSPFEHAFRSIVEGLAAAPEEVERLLRQTLEQRGDGRAVAVACLVLVALLLAERRFDDLYPLAPELAWCLRSGDLNQQEAAALTRLHRRIKSPEGLTHWDLLDAAHALGPASEAEPADSTAVTH